MKACSRRSEGALGAPSAPSQRGSLSQSKAAVSRTLWRNVRDSPEPISQVSPYLASQAGPHQDALQVLRLLSARQKAQLQCYHYQKRQGCVLHRHRVLSQRDGRRLHDGHLLLAPSSGLRC